jgi:simple sugar transport system permease protein
MPDLTVNAISSAEPAAEPVGEAASARRRLVLARLRDFALVPAIIVIAIVGEAINPVFLHFTNIVTILQTMSEVGVLVLAETMILLVGKMDLSLESTMGLAPGVAAWLTVAPGVTHGLGWLAGAWAVPVCLAVGALIGATNGLLIVRFRLNAFVVTLGMLITLRGVLTGISGGETFFGLPPSMTWLGQTLWLSVPVSVWLCLALYAVAIVVMSYTRWGRSLYAIGGNVDAAKAAGIRTDRIVWTVLTIGGTLAALGGLMLSGRLASVAASQGQGDIFTVFAACAIGGISLRGGKGTVFGAFTGVLLLFMIQNVLTLAGVAAQWIDALNGVVILAALIISRVTSGQEQE